jgi:hypothetical protein
MSRCARITSPVSQPWKGVGEGLVGDDDLDIARHATLAEAPELIK